MNITKFRNFSRINLFEIHVYSWQFSFRAHVESNGFFFHQAQDVQIVVWLLKHCVLFQLHTYVFLVPGPKGKGITSASKSVSLSHSGPSPRSFEDVPVFKAQSVPDTASGND